MLGVYDNEKSIKAKIDFANKRGLDGLMIWAVNLDNGKGDALRWLTGKERTHIDDPLALELNDSSLIAHSTDDATRCMITDCAQTCPCGWAALSRANTKSDGSSDVIPEIP